jgi:hypothetical protein
MAIDYADNIFKVLYLCNKKAIQSYKLLNHIH